jgi:RhtB (resistance to homoserine/threonine) family protein
MAIALLAGMSPGPDFFLVTKNSLGYGRKIGVASALGIATALMVHATYTILGLAVIIQRMYYLFALIQLLGAAYLAYLGINSLCGSFQAKKMEINQVERSLPRKSFMSGFMNGFLCNILNPKAFVFFLSIFSQFMTPGTSRRLEWIYGFEVVLAVGCWFIILAVLISLPVFAELYQKSRVWLERFFGAVLLFFAIKVCGSVFYTFLS